MSQLRSQLAALVVCALWGVCSWPTRAQELGGALGIRLEPAQITVGDPTRAELTLVWEGAAPKAIPQFPKLDGSWGKAEVLESGPVETMSEGPRRIYRQTLKLTAFEPGTLELPPIQVTVPLATGDVQVKSQTAARLLVASVLPGEKSKEDPAAETEPKGPAGLVGLQLSPWPFRISALVLLVLNAGALWLLAQKVARQKPLPVVAAVASEYAHLSPFEELLERLKGLATLPPIEAHTAISFALRQFLGRTVDSQALESTTTEIQRRLRQVLPVGLGNEVVNLLRECDRVKFAGIEVAGPETSQRVEKTRALGQQVVDRIRPATERLP